MIRCTGSLSKGWLARHLNVAFDRDYYFDLDKRFDIDRQCQAYAASELPDLDVFYTESNLGQPDHFSAQQILVGGIQPNMILGMLVGAEFVPHASMDADISMTPLKGKDPDQLPEPGSLLDHDLIQLFDRQIRQIQAEGELQPIPPFFWDASGRATTHGTLTTAQKFLGESLFVDLMLEPERALRVMDWMTESFIVLMKHFSQVGRLPITGVHIGECSGCMVNPDLFARCVVPHASRMADALGPLRFHSCGASTHVLEGIKTIAGLASLDLGGDTSVARAREIFGPSLPIDVAPVPADFCAESPEPILQWAEQVIRENRDGHMRIIYHLEADYRLENVRALNDYVRELGS
ncbi:MAG: hypothetical protein GY809_13905 [Planctomycetes bacterium]|nr:hypothetical protein [Planctomycetota bacterium]